MHSKWSGAWENTLVYDCKCWKQSWTKIATSKKWKRINLQSRSVIEDRIFDDSVQKSIWIWVSVGINGLRQNWLRSLRSDNRDCGSKGIGGLRIRGSSNGDCGFGRIGWLRIRGSHNRDCGSDGDGCLGIRGSYDPDRCVSRRVRSGQREVGSWSERSDDRNELWGLKKKFHLL